MQYSKLLVFLFFSICIPDFCHSQEPFAGPFRIVLRQLAQCDDSGTRQIYATSTRLSKVSRTQYLYETNITSQIEINDDLTMELDSAIFGNGGWRPHYMQIDFPQFCTSLKQMMPDRYSAIVNALHTECPFPPGTYEVKDFGVGSFKTSSMPKFPYGKYRVDILGRINGTLVGCLRYYCDIVPAKRERPQKKKKNN